MLNPRNPYAAYGRDSLETEIEVASPHKLILMLFDGALAALVSARLSMEAGKVAEKGQAIGKAISIVDAGLRSALNPEAGGELAVNLDALYEYIGMRLIEANLENSVIKLDEAHRLLADLRDAWDQIGPSKTAASVAEGVPPVRTGSVSYGNV